jgi:hypothetical protein
MIIHLTYQCCVYHDIIAVLSELFVPRIGRQFSLSVFVSNLLQMTLWSMAVLNYVLYSVTSWPFGSMYCIQSRHGRSELCTVFSDVMAVRNYVLYSVTSWPFGIMQCQWRHGRSELCTIFSDVISARLFHSSIITKPFFMLFLVPTWLSLRHVLFSL